jgi:hypothetical protein
MWFVARERFASKLGSRRSATAGRRTIGDLAPDLVRNAGDGAAERAVTAGETGPSPKWIMNASSGGVPEIRVLARRCSGQSARTERESLVPMYLPLGVAVLSLKTRSKSAPLTSPATVARREP